MTADWLSIVLCPIQDFLSCVQSPPNDWMPIEPWVLTCDFSLMCYAFYDIFMDPPSLGGSSWRTAFRELSNFMEIVGP